MRKLILVKYSLPAIIPGAAARQWHLSGEGHLRCKSLADRLASYQPAAIVTSTEPKAQETAMLIATHLGGIPCETAEGLHEHDRSNVGYLSTEAFQQTVATFFAQPETLVFGRETASQAQERFSQAIADVLERHTIGNVVLVAHGTVITLFVIQHTQMEPFALWQRLGLPSFVVLALPGFELLEVADNAKLSTN